MVFAKCRFPAFDCPCVNGLVNALCDNCGVMKDAHASRTIVPPSFFAKLMLPFAIPMLVTLALVLLVGESWPRNIAPGSGLKLAGFVATALTGAMVWHRITRSIADRRAHKMAALVCAVTGLMGWPVWSVGVLPSVNGIRLGPPEAVRMALERTEVTTVSKSSQLNHWAWLQPASPGPEAEAGRYFIPEATYQQWASERPRTVTVTFARGLLGARVVVGYQ
jgi:hypothetical protein